MIGATSFIQILKYGFITLVVSCGGYLIASITVVKHYKGESIDGLVYKPQISQTSEGVTSLLDKGFEKCLMWPSTSFCLMSANRRISLLRSKGLDETPHQEDVNITLKKSSERHHQHPITSILRHFSNVTRAINVKPVLLEPSMLFCMLSPIHKVFLLTEEFNPSRLQGNKKVVTVGILEEDSKVLDQKDSLNVAMASGFQVSRVRRWYEGSVFEEKSTRPNDFHTIHYFFTRRTSVVHAVVLFGKKNYLWHADLNEEDWGIQDLLYVKDVAYDNFTAVRIETEDLGMDLYLPSNPVHFMLQIENSEFHTCSGNTSDVFSIHPSLTDDQLQNRVTVAIKELKAIFQPHFVRFWLWDKSLFGWYSECNLLHVTAELNLAIAYAKLGSMNLTAEFAGNEYLKVVYNSSIDGKDSKFSLDCHGLRINIFVAYEDGTSVRFYESADGNKHPDGLVYPKFQLCTTDIFGQRVQVPCDPDIAMKSVSLQK